MSQPKVITAKDENPRDTIEELTFDLREMYRLDPKDAVPDISHMHYSNLAFIHVSNRDVYIDFLEMPGVKKEGKVLIPGIRIFLTHAAAQKLAEALNRTLETVSAKGDFEKFGVKEEKKIETE